MSFPGWAKFDLDMKDDPRLLQAAQQLGGLYVLARSTPGGGMDLSESDALTFACNAVTGALMRLWSYAHTHIRDDDTLPMGRETLNAMVGIVHFFEIMPREWIDELEDGTVVLPGYCKKNSLIAKRNATAKGNARVAAFRARKKINGNGVTHALPPALPQRVTGVSKVVDVDEDIDTKKRKDKEGEKRGNGEVTPLHQALPGNGHAPEPWSEDSPTPAPESEAFIHEQIAILRGLYPEGGREDWGTAEHAIRHLVLKGFTWSEAQDVEIRFAKHCKATGNNVMNPAKFWTAHDKPWLQRWTIPTKAKPTPTHVQRKSAAELEAEEADAKR